MKINNFSSIKKVKIILSTAGDYDEGVGSEIERIEKILDDHDIYHYVDYHDNDFDDSTINICLTDEAEKDLAMKRDDLKHELLQLLDRSFTFETIG